MAHQSTTWGSLAAAARRHTPSPKRLAWAIPVAIFALLGAGAFWHFFPALTGGTASAATLRADFSLELERAGTDYRVTWDGQSPVVQAATRGVLLIKDGGFEKELELDRDQLATAGVVYAPSTADVVFRLELFGGPENAVASVRLLAGSRPQVAAEVQAPETVVPVEQAPPVVFEEPPAETPADVAARPAASEVPATLAAAPRPEDIPAPPAR